jgi:hypothetical protein
MQQDSRVMIKVDLLPPEVFRRCDPNTSEKIARLTVARDGRVTGSGDMNPYTVFDAYDWVCLQKLENDR